MLRLRRSADRSLSPAGFAARCGRVFRGTERGSDAGNASLEFITAGMFLLLPMVYLVLTMAALQAGSFAVEGAARQAVRVYVQAGSTAEASAEATSAVRFALADYGIDSSAASIQVTCAPNPGDCLHRLGHVTVTIGVVVQLPLVPQFITVHLPLAVPVTSTATEQVSRFWHAG